MNKDDWNLVAVRNHETCSNEDRTSKRKTKTKNRGWITFPLKKIQFGIINRYVNKRIENNVRQFCNISFKICKGSFNNVDENQVLLNRLSVFKNFEASKCHQFWDVGGMHINVNGLKSG